MQTIMIILPIVAPVFLLVAKLAACTFAGVIVGQAVNLDPAAFAVLILQLGTPVVVSTALAVITIPITLAFLV